MYMCKCLEYVFPRKVVCICARAENMYVQVKLYVLQVQGICMAKKICMYMCKCRKDICLMAKLRF